MRLFIVMICAVASASTTACLSCPEGAPQHRAADAQVDEKADWREAEKGMLADQVQLTFADRFFKAGESYFSPDDKRIIFQAVERPAKGDAPDEFYAMFVADVVRDGAGTIKGIDNVERISPKGSANTCGWFHPTDPNVVIFASTIDAPIIEELPQFERLGSRYKWMFPKNMKIVRCRLDREAGAAAALEVLAGDDRDYHAECSLSSDGRHLLYCSLAGERGDIYVKDLQTNATNRIVQSKGYDGGPFFSPDGKRICYRADRRNEHYLQLFVADLAFNQKGEIVGIEREHQLTDDDLLVHWCPFWTLDGRRLVYSTSELGHTNYEVFIIDADPGDLAGSTGTIRYGTRRQRITHSDRADVLPAFSTDGKMMIWTSQRGTDGESQLWAGRFIFDPDATIQPADEKPKTPAKNQDENRIVVEDPETGRIFVYDLSTHTLSEYSLQTHKLTEITDKALIDRFTELYESQQGEN
jgi:TolB protein